MWQDYKIVEMSLALSSNTVNALAKEETVSVNVTSTNEWSVSLDADWISAKKENGTLGLTISANPTAEVREATFKVSSEGTTDQVITVTQEAGTTGADDYDNAAVKLFPNPANSIVYINGEDKFSAVSIFDVNGKRVLHQNLSENRVDVSTLVNGIYTVRLEGKNCVRSSRFIKK